MTNVSFINECAKIVQGMRDKIILTPEGDFYKKSTILNISNKLNNFREYEIVLGVEIRFEDLNYQWSEDYRLYLLNKNYAKNTVSAILSVLKSFVKRFHRQGEMSYSGAGIRTSNEITTAVFNSIDDIKKLLSLDLPKGKERIRDVYVMQCFLGLRVRDMFGFIKDVKINLKTINEKVFFEIKTNKTGEVVVIPASKIVLKIVKNRNYDFGEKFSEQYYRRELKDIYAQSGLDRDILFHRTEGGERIERTVLFSSLLGTHSARRTFATNAYLLGLNPLDIMKITGHKTFTAFIRYIRCENIAVALRISDHEFFNLDL
jgi:integrase